MTARRVLYVAHCLRPTEEEIAELVVPNTPVPLSSTVLADRALRRNLDRALGWRNWLRTTFADVTFIAPWIGDVAMGDDDSDSAQRERGIRDNCALISRLDGVVLCGPRISAGMHAEVAALLERVVNIDQPRAGDIYNLISLGATPPPADMSDTETFEHWAGRIESDARERPLTLDDVWCHGCVVEKLGAGICRKHGEAP